MYQGPLEGFSEPSHSKDLSTLYHDGPYHIPQHLQGQTLFSLEIVR